MIPLYSELREAPRVKLADAVPLACPFTLYVDPTSFCNFKCVQCPVGQAEYDVTPTTMRLEHFEKIAKDVRAMGRLKSLKLYLQGEPLLHPQIGDFVLIGKKISDRVEITSNCSVLSQQKALQLIAAGLDYLQVSVYGSSEEQQKRVTNSAISAERVRENVARLRAMRDAAGQKNPFIFARFFKDAPEREEEFFKLWAPIADECGIDAVHDWDGQLNLSERLYGIGEQTPATDVPCPYPFYTLTVKASGKVTVCCVDWSDGAEVGDIHKESLADIWHGQRLNDLRMLHLERRRGEHTVCGKCRIPDRSPDDMTSMSAEAWSQRNGR